MADIEQTNLTKLTTDLLSAYFANNVVDSAQLPDLIKSTHEALKGIDSPEPEAAAEPEFVPAVSLRRSLASKDHLISMIDGKPYKTLKRHLGTQGLTPAEYRQRYKLPQDYPMVAPSYSEQRRAVAAKLGLGRKRAAPEAAPAAPPETPAEATPAVGDSPKPERPNARKASAAASSSKAKPTAPAKPQPAKKTTKAKVATKPAKASPAESAAALTAPPAAPAKATRGRKNTKTVPLEPAAAEAKTPAKRATRKTKQVQSPASRPNAE